MSGPAGKITNSNNVNYLKSTDSIENALTGINSAEGRKIVRAAKRSGCKNIDNLNYNSERDNQKLKAAFRGGRNEVKKLLTKEWGWTAAAFEQIFPEKNNFNWNYFCERTERVVREYDEMPEENKKAYCGIRDLSYKSGLATYSDFVPGGYQAQANETVNKLSGKISESYKGIKSGGGKPDDPAASAIYDSVKKLNEVAPNYLEKDITFWPAWLKEAVYLRLAVKAESLTGGKGQIVKNSTVDDAKLRAYLLQEKREEQKEKVAESKKEKKFVSAKKVDHQIKKASPKADAVGF